MKAVAYVIDREGHAIDIPEYQLKFLNKFEHWCGMVLQKYPGAVIHVVDDEHARFHITDKGMRELKDETSEGS